MSIRIRKRYSESSTVTLFPGDCLALMKKIPAGAAQLILTSPPYNVGKTYETVQTLQQYLQNQWYVSTECIRITADAGSIPLSIHSCDGNDAVAEEYSHQKIEAEAAQAKLRT